MQLRLLRLFLGFAAFAWGISVVGVFLSWSAAEEALRGLGAKPIAYDPMLDYWLRMASGAYALIGAWYLALMIWPQKFAAAIPWFGALMLLEGFLLLFHGRHLGHRMAALRFCFLSVGNRKYANRLGSRRPHPCRGAEGFLQRGD
jgi:hypothetical protein